MGFLLLVACDSKEPRPGAPLDEPASVHNRNLSKLAHELDVDASTLVEPVAPLSPPGDLAAEMAQFTTLDACMTEHASKDPLVSDALDALGYDTFSRDVCRTLEALHTKSLTPCARIDASGLRRACTTEVAITTGDADACPLRLDEAPGLGRDPTCLAVASGDARLCAAERRERRVRCEALTARDDARCGAFAAGKAVCVRDVARWKTAIVTPARANAPQKLGARVAVSSADPAFDAGRIDIDLRSIAEAGVVLVAEHADELTCQVGVPRESGAAPLAPSPEMGARLAFAFAIARDGSASLRHLELELPGRAVLVAPPLHFDGNVVVTKARTRGDPLTITLHGKVVAAPRSYDVQIDLETFIEDVIDHSPTSPDRHP